MQQLVWLRKDSVATQLEEPICRKLNSLRQHEPQQVFAYWLVRKCPSPVAPTRRPRVLTRHKFERAKTIGRHSLLATLSARRIRAVSSSTPVAVRRGRRTRSWSGSDNCTTVRSEPASCRTTRGVRSVWPKQNRCSTESSRASRSWRSGRCPRVRWARWFCKLPKRF